LSDAVLMHSKRISSGQKKVEIIPIIISKRLFSGRLVLLFVVDVACGRMMSHFDGRFCGTRTQEGGWVGLGWVGSREGVGWVVSDLQEAATILAQDLGSSISTSDSGSLPPALLLYPVSESLHSLSKLHSDADLSLS